MKYSSGHRVKILYEHKNRLKKLLYPVLGNLFPLQFLTKFKFYGGVHFLKWRSFVKRSQWLTQDEIRAYQNKQLAAILPHCYKHVPYYKTSFDQLGIHPDTIHTVEDLNRLPLITKEIIFSNFDLLTADNAKHFNYEKLKTGGSTGKVLYFYHDKKIRGLMSALVRRLEKTAGQRVSDRYVMMRSAIGYRAGAINMEKLYTVDPIARMLEINTANLTIENIQNALSYIKEYKALYLHSYPSIAYALAKFILKNPAYRVPLKGVIVSSELLYPAIRNAIEQAFCCAAYDFYGQEEAVGWAMSCEYKNLHVCHELGILEIIKNGKPCAPNEIGQFVCTGLHNYSMPLVRYAIGDYGCFKDIVCPCGRRSPVIEVLGGREKDLLVTPSGMIKRFDDYLFNDLNGIKEYQIIQDSINELCIKVVKETDSQKADIQQFLKKIKDFLGDDMKIQIEFVDTIFRTSANKYKMVISKVPLPFD